MSIDKLKLVNPNRPSKENSAKIPWSACMVHVIYRHTYNAKKLVIMQRNTSIIEGWQMFWSNNWNKVKLQRLSTKVTKLKRSGIKHSLRPSLVHCIERLEAYLYAGIYYSICNSLSWTMKLGIEDANLLVISYSLGYHRINNNICHGWS